MESKRSHSPLQLNLLIGMTVALGLVLCAFEYGVERNGPPMLGSSSTDDWNLEDELPPITQRKKLPTPPKEPRLKPQPVLTSTTVLAIQTDPDPDPSDLPEFDLGDFEDLFPVETAVAPAINPLDFADEMPEFPGGEEALMKFLRDNIKYPGYARDNRIEGKLFVKFVIDAKGNVGLDTFEVYKSPHESLSNEAIRVVKMMPQWKPGRQGPRNVPVYVKLPVRFRLR